MPVNHHKPSPADVASSLALATEVFAYWRAGKVVVLDHNGIKVDGQIWVPAQVAPSTDITEQANSFVFRDGKWSIGYAGTENSFKRLDGFKYIHLLLSGKPIHPSNLIQLANYRGSGNGQIKANQYAFEEGGALEGLNIQNDSKSPIPTKDAHRTIRKELAMLEEDLAVARTEGDREQVEELEEKIAEIKRHLEKAAFKGLERPFSDQYKLDLDKVRNAIKRAIKSIGTVNAELAWHLTVSIQYGAKCVYRPEKSVPWNLYQCDDENVAPMTMESSDASDSNSGSTDSEPAVE